MKNIGSLLLDRLNLTNGKLQEQPVRARVVLGWVRTLVAPCLGDRYARDRISRFPLTDGILGHQMRKEKTHG
jgi:hypothetical protein